MKEGKTIPASLEHVIFYPTISANQYSAIVVLHGRGTDEYDLIPLVLELGLPSALVISPRAPQPFALGGGFAWYDLGQEGIPHPQTFRTSLNLLERFLSEIRTGYPVDPERIILLGFSQGTVMGYAAALLDPTSFLGLAALSGYIPLRSGLKLNLHMLSRFTAFISHGTLDQVIPIRLGREAADLLKKAGANVQYQEYPMGHEVREETVRDLSAWTKSLLE